MRILTWNIERKPPESAAARLMLERIAASAPEIVCLTEAQEGSLGDLGGHVISEKGASWGGETESERKVALWSKSPWRDATKLPALLALGGAVSAVTDTSLGPVRVIGVCSPSPFASPGGALPRPPHWSMHIEFLEALGPALKVIDSHTPTILVGDFNQFLPLIWGSWKAHHALMKSLHGFGVITQGDIAPIGEHAIDHVAVSKHLRAASVSGLGRFDEAGKSLSDHFGVAADLEAGGVQIFD